MTTELYQVWGSVAFRTLTLVKAQQDLKYALKVMTNSEKIGYRKRPRKVYGSEEVTNLLPARDAV